MLYAFCAQSKNDQSCPDGATPYGGLIMHRGKLYGTTAGGGNSSDPYAGGTVFELVPYANGVQHTILYSFCAQSGCPDGSTPLAGLVMDHSGNLYGTTLVGGGHSYGSVFELTPGSTTPWTEQVLYSFCTNNDCADGDSPAAPLIMDAAGNLYGTAQYNRLRHDKGGSVFKLTP